MKKVIYLLLTGVLFYSCNSGDILEEEVNTYNSCLEEYFEQLPLGRCIGLASDNSPERSAYAEEVKGKLYVNIQIDECLKQLDRYHSWIAAELQFRCLDNKASVFNFTDGGSNTYFKLNRDELPDYIEHSNNRDLYMSKDVEKYQRKLIQETLFSKMPSESSFFVYKDNNFIHICAIQHIEAGNRDDLDRANNTMMEMSKHFLSVELNNPTMFHTLEAYGRSVTEFQP